MKKDSKPKRRSPVKKFMDRFQKPKTHRDKTKYRRKGLKVALSRETIEDKKKTDE